MTKTVSSVTETRTIYAFNKDDIKEILCRKARIKVNDVVDITLDDDVATIIVYKRSDK